ncbi:IS1595 family transposase [Candidatus Peregrinibacteria bacterium]|nr:IS1595 family transposase [Candidatus Peregrinibacteria bacterium]MBI3816512.1 IS1595 family transposase [Candidatus Peregrinibacteria bacterium]
MKSPRLTILNFHKTFPDNDTCLRFLLSARFPRPKCKTCGGTKFYKHPTRACFTCAKGCTHLWPKEGTIFGHSSTDLVKWFFAIFLMSQSRNGVAAKELERALGVTYKCAFRIGHQVRKLMKDNAFALFGEIEADETAVGGKRKGKRGRGAEGKTIVFGQLQRKGMMNAAIVENVKAATLIPHMQDNIAKGSKLMTDELKSYKKIARLLEMEHDTVVHGAKQYAKENGTHTNTIEGFWSQLKRSLDGTHHIISPKMLHAYVSEFQWRYNNRQSMTHLFELLLSRVSSRQGLGA